MTVTFNNATEVCFVYLNTGYFGHIAETFFPSLLCSKLYFTYKSPLRCMVMMVNSLAEKAHVKKEMREETKEERKKGRKE